MGKNSVALDRYSRLIGNVLGQVGEIPTFSAKDLDKSSSRPLVKTKTLPKVVRR